MKTMLSMHWTLASSGASNDSDPLSHAEKLVNNALDDLEATGALQRSNQMDIAAFLNPAVESHNMFEVTDEDIFEAVMDAKERRNAHGGDNNSDDNSDSLGVPAQGPTRRELLQAAVMLKRHLATINDPFSRNLEVMLGSFGQRTHAAEMQSMTDTKLTDYFVRK
jgi:hypothetical protein